MVYPIPEIQVLPTARCPILLPFRVREPGLQSEGGSIVGRRGIHRLQRSVSSAGADVR